MEYILLPNTDLICQFSDALGIEVAALKSLENTVYRQEENPPESIDSFF